MPTFRKSVDFSRMDSTSELALGVPILKDRESCNELNTFLAANNALLIVKIHPMQDLTTVKIKDMSNILVLDANTVKQRGVDNYHLMKDVDALISDYSSAAYDFLHADKPIAYTLDDAEDYKLGFLFENRLTICQVISCTIRKSLSVLLRTSLTERIHIGRNAEKSRIFSLSITTEMAPRDLQSILD